MIHISRLNVKNCILVIFGNVILAFGLYNVHSISGITEGGVLGLTLLLKHHFGISPSVSGLVVNIACYALGYKVLGKSFIGYSALASAAFSAAYFVCEQYSPLFPEISELPFVAAVAGAVFVGVGAGLSVMAGGATGGDDAISMSVSQITGMKIQWIYLISDVTVLLLSITYIPFTKIAYSLITVVLSGQIIGFIKWLGLKKNEVK